MSSLQFLIPKSVANALPIEDVAAKARAALIDRPRLEYNERHAGGQVRITCQPAMARFLIDLVRGVAGRAGAKGETELVIACGQAIHAAMTAIEAEGRDGDTTFSKDIGRIAY